MRKKLLFILLAFSLSANAQRLSDTVYHEINLHLAQYKQQQMTGMALQLLAGAIFYGMQSQEQTKEQHNISFCFGFASLYIGTIIRVNAYDNLYFKR